MADIFLSYARPDREFAQKLANRLIQCGYQVWWDTELVGSDDFRDVILDELKLAKAVIVIWSEVLFARNLCAMRLTEPTKTTSSSLPAWRVLTSKAYR